MSETFEPEVPVDSFDAWGAATAAQELFAIFKGDGVKVRVRQYQPPFLTVVGEGATYEAARHDAAVKLAQRVSERQGHD